MRTRICAAITTLLVLAAPQPPGAWADERTVEDADDSASALDISSVTQGHYGGYALYLVTAFEPWGPEDLAGGRMVFNFDLDDDPAIERQGVLEYSETNGSGLRTVMLNGDGDRIGRAVHRRPSERSVELWFTRGQLKHAKTYRMFVTLDTPDGCSAEPCTDRAPDAGAIRHRLRKLCLGAEPTIVGTSGDDVLRATSGSDLIDGRGGDDRIVGLEGGDGACGGKGDDVVEAGSGFIGVSGGPGSDRISVTGPRPRPCDDVVVASCAYPEALALGGAGDDVLLGGRYHERLIGGGGDDVLSGRRTRDVLDGGKGRDVARGGKGRDSCSGAEVRHSC